MLIESLLTKLAFTETDRALSDARLVATNEWFTFFGQLFGDDRVGSASPALVAEKTLNVQTSEKPRILPIGDEICFKI